MFDKYRYKYDRANDEYKKFLAKNGISGKNKILSNYLTSGIRVSEEIFPDIYRSIETVLQNLNITDSFDFFITPEITANATCIQLGQKSSIIIINSKLIELLTFDELSFVIGHEIGHHIYCHYSENINFNSSEDIKELILDNSRKMELSCDRIGLLGVKDFDIASNAILKLVSGLGSNYIINDSKVYLKQLRELQNIGIQDEKDKTHHSWLIRMQALKLFSMSLEYNDFINSRNGGKELSKIDDVIEKYLNKLTGIDQNKKETEIYDKAMLFIFTKFLYDSIPFNETQRNIFEIRFGEDKTKKILNLISGSSQDQYKIKCDEHLKKLNSLDRSLRIKFHEEVIKLLGSFNRSLSASESRHFEIELGL